MIDEILNKENEDSKNIVKNEKDVAHDDTADSDNSKEVYKAYVNNYPNLSDFVFN